MINLMNAPLDQRMTKGTISAALDWQAVMGADEAIGEMPTDWAAYAMPEWWQNLKSPQQVQANAPIPLPTANMTPLARMLATPAPATLTPLSMTTPADAAARVEATTLEALAAELKAFEGCALKKTALNFVFGEGNPASRIMLIGEGPGADEDRQGRPFVGRSGQLLDRMLAAIGLSSRETYYITNVTPWRPPGNRTPTDTEVAVLRPFLMRHIELVDPALIVTLGGLPTKTLLNKPEGITRLRGKFLPFKTEDSKPEIKVMPVFHPAALLRNPAQKAFSWQDMLKVKEFLKTNGLGPVV